jgi:predicted Zn-dependent protease
MAVFLEMAGNAELELGHYGEATEDFRRATILRPSYPRTWAGLAAAHALAGRTVEARDAARKLKTLASTSTPHALLEKFGRHETSRLRQGLGIALGADSASERDTQHSAYGPQPYQAQ